MKRLPNDRKSSNQWGPSPAYEEPDELINPMGIKGVGEIGIVGVAAAVANAIYHATGKRVRELPITLDKVMG
jgi:xanthine dehydrogenase YagR molybdenum-binding subunit